MRHYSVQPVSLLKGEIFLPGDKSIAHRAIILGALSKGKTVIKNFPSNRDCLSTVSVFKQLGIRISADKKANVVTIFGKGLFGLAKPKRPVFISESGTTMRLLLGVLAGQLFSVTVTAGKVLCQRPMRRVTEPLRLMGAQIGSRLRAQGSKLEEYPPILIKGGDLHAITYKTPVASAQVKSAILLSGLYAEGRTVVIESLKTRDHTEQMLRLFRADIKSRKNKISITGREELASPRKIYVPGDISSASFFIVAATIVSGSKLQIKNVSLNPTRTGIISVLKRMGADIQLSAFSSQLSAYEPMGNLIIKSSLLKGTIVKKAEIPFLIDELPVLMVAACFAKGKTVFQGVEELRVKETDRIKSMCVNLKKMGASIKVIKSQDREKIVINGVEQLKGTKVRSFGDHRTAMSMIIAGLAAEGKTSLDDISCIDKSFPEFIHFFKTLTRKF
ncbi:MAG: 3-phosphoshikimate 1-carboxyvinyltransferase [Candidatus Omnitrophica bacterium]|jgi:3-phosphoshikimate 1-carboxyvinyltransferase|nr:3-phosphoshikimate 1-carboxyvinyltransferase [Candidatus Omnitrophota bacterium]